ncbi:MAG: sulfite exporter TauE/SafE family protein [Mariniphaga sp.]|nr:sulfite exporter TauE/SafE family protein [Mariniphaga sp.]MDD4226438.1 sulfite exporter TauE/SafE family protein [Mariniphaga sp.]
MEWYMVLALLGTGLFAGFINTTAGGGSMLSLPLLMFLGLPANVANGTNRVAVLFQSVVGTHTFRKKKVLDLTSDSRLVLPALVGSIIGALIAVEMDVLLLEKVIAGLMVVMLLLVVIKPGAWVAGHAGITNPKPTLLQYILFFFIGVYGGFIQMGVGFFLLAGLVLGCGYNLVKANAVKVYIILGLTVFTIGIFMYYQQIDWLAGLILAVGNAVGAWIGVHFTIRGGARYVRIVLILALVIVILNLFGVF